MGLAAAVLLASAWFFAGGRGVILMAAGMGCGWLVRHATPWRGMTGSPPPAPDPACDATARLAALEAKTSSLRHDLRGILSPALLTAERLLSHEDPAIRRAGEMMVKTVERASARLAETKG